MSVLSFIVESLICSGLFLVLYRWMLAKLNTVHSVSPAIFSDGYNGTSIIGIVTESTIVTIR